MLHMNVNVSKNVVADGLMHNFIELQVHFCVACSMTALSRMRVVRQASTCTLMHRLKELHVHSCVAHPMSALTAYA